jgi:hypothetical protein
MAELNRESVLEWLRGLSEGRWLELMTAACQQRGSDPALDPTSRGMYAVAHMIRLDTEDPWSVELVAREDRSHYAGWSVEDCTVIRGATCRGCGTRVGSWALWGVCPVCGTQVECH